jgi:hypothetical protein
VRDANRMEPAPEMEPLTPLVGEWNVETSLGDVRARTTFEWTLDGRFLVQRSEIELAEAPDALSVIASDAEHGGFTQHYFDSRGVVRVYAMTFEGGVWTLLRERPDFTPLNFSQRYVGEFSDDGDTITGRWERGESLGAPLQHDFDLNYTRVP